MKTVIKTSESKMTAAEATITAKTTFTPPASATIQRSPWHSPVPYLFGGLAAMLGLIAFALLILACSYWKLSDQTNGAGEGERDVEAGDDDHKGENAKTEMAALPFEEKIVVIMAGDVKPTFLATPMSSRDSLFGVGNGKKEKEIRNEEFAEKPKQEDEETLQSQVSQEQVH
ncbi:protein GLUTAMINE DUMPER 2-like [Olea europaea var. sylvestris]|uniref:protein GLUTAMINE DUMPER 2-like n=1 Tax=Olea europaea var. sylvestris TaxID=158386 RepID=UPI000C1D19DC|nr:protein GLUTAMINE DUMPER 2-like [Olea europaea var. sylvestris]